METISLTTADSVSLKALHWPCLSGGPRKGAILLHMMPAVKESWVSLGSSLSATYDVIAPDLRGHGESEGGPDSYASFTSEQHQASKTDVVAAANYLRERGAEELVLIGASIGANLALQFAANDPTVQSVVLLSAGLNYYGIETLPFVDRLRLGQRIFFAASEDDMRKSGNSAAMMAQQLYLATPDAIEKKIIIYHAAGHGTDMFKKESPDLEKEILGWLGVS